MSSESIKAALVANTSIALAKTVAAVFTASSSMAAEAIHSFADCGNQVLLMYGNKAANKQPDKDHPLGYGMATYFWSFIVALVLFSLGGVYSVYEGLHKINTPENLSNVQYAVAVLIFGIVMEGRSLLICLNEIKDEYKDKSYFWFFKETRNNDLLIIFAEDTAAILGLLVALISLSLSWYTGDPIYDAVGSIIIGVILIGVSAFLIREVMALMIGQSVDPLNRKMLRDHIFNNCPEIEHTYDCHTLQTGKTAILMLRVRMVEKESVKKLIDDINNVERSIHSKFPFFNIISVEPDNSHRDF